MLSYCLLHDTLGLSIRYIAKNIFSRWHNSVAAALKHYKELQPAKFKIDREFEDNLKECQTKLLTYLNTHDEWEYILNEVIQTIKRKD